MTAFQSLNIAVESYIDGGIHHDYQGKYALSSKYWLLHVSQQEYFRGVN